MPSHLHISHILASRMLTSSPPHMSRRQESIARIHPQSFRCCHPRPFNSPLLSPSHPHIISCRTCHAGKSQLHEFVECDGGASAITTMQANLTGKGWSKIRERVRVSVGKSECGLVCGLERG